LIPGKYKKNGNRSQPWLALGLDSGGNGMKAIIVYDSQYGNTEKIANVIEKVLQQQGEVTVIKVSDAGSEILNGMDLVVVGSPTQQFRATATMREFLKNIPRDGLRETRVAAFDTRLTQEFIDKNPPLPFFERIFGYAAERIAKALKQKGGNLVLPGEGFYVEGMEGPLSEGEQQRAQEWAGKLFA
jgi:flavodoxin